MSDNKSNFLAGLIIGGLIGITLGILFAPKSGKESRADVARKADQLIVKAKEEYEKASEQMTGVESFRDFKAGGNEELV